MIYVVYFTIYKTFKIKGPPRYRKGCYDNSHERKVFLAFDGILYGYQAINMPIIEAGFILDIKRDSVAAGLHPRNVFLGTE
jgi:hypothetical protein